MRSLLFLLVLSVTSLLATPQADAREYCIDIYFANTNIYGNSECWHIWICDGAGGDGWAYTDGGLCE